MCVTRFTEPKNSQHFNVNKNNSEWKMVFIKMERIESFVTSSNVWLVVVDEEAQRSTDYSFLPPIIILEPYSFLKPPFLVYEGFT